MLLCFIAGTLLLTVGLNSKVGGRSITTRSAIGDVLDSIDMGSDANKTTCRANGRDYPDGRPMLIPDKYDNIEQASCRDCTCVSGEPSECKKVHCDLHRGGGWCENYGPVPPGECCPMCECIHNGQVMQEGASWVAEISEGREIADCRCEGRRATCKRKIISTVSTTDTQEPTPTPTQETATTQAPITIVLPETTARPIFTLPPMPIFRRDKSKQEDKSDFKGL